jgi:hypothetical protein
MYVDLPSPAEVRALLDVSGRPCVSIYLPTTPQPTDAEAERIAFKNLVSDAIDQLQAAGVDKREVASFAEELAELDDDPFFWRYQANTLVVLATADEVRSYHLANRLSPIAVVAEQFFVKPLLRALSFPSAGYVLALAQGSVRLLEFGPDYGPLEVSVDGLPANLDSFIQTVPGAEGSSVFGVLSQEGHDSRLRKYARQVDRAVRAALRGEDLPVVLAAVEPLASVFRSVSTLPNLADEGIAGNPETVPAHELVAAARGVLDGIYAQQVRELADLFELRSGQGRAVTDLADVARAATFGAVDVLIVDIDRVVPGILGEDGSLELTDEPGSYDVVDLVARRVLLNGGRVVAVRADEVPGGREAAALLRYA